MPEEKPVCRQPAPVIEPEPVEDEVASVPDVELSRDVIFAADDLITERVEVPEWGGHVFVKTLPGYQRDQFDQAVQNNRRGKRLNLEGLSALLVVRTTCDAKGQRLFTEADLKALNNKSCKAIGRIFEVASRLNGLSAEDVETLLGNSESDLSDSSGSS